MEDLRAVMQIIDRNSDSISEGDYLELCNRMKKLYKTKGGYRTLFNYEEPMVDTLNQSDATIDYFENHYIDRALDVDKSFLEIQMDYILRERDAHKPIKRLTKRIRETAISHYCTMHNIILDENTPECLKSFHEESGYILGDLQDTFEVALDKLYKSYMYVENQYRYNLRDLVEKRAERMAWMIDDLDSV